MTTIEYGGGPTIEQRRKFCNIPPGGHIPGYMGFVPQFKYQCGSTYRKETHKVAEIFPYYNGPSQMSEININPLICRDKISFNRKVFKDEVSLNKIPKSTGDNKYTESMVPGYSGDVPRILFKFGKTYRALCDECIDEFVSDYMKNKNKHDKITEVAAIFPKLKSIDADPRVKNHMNIWSDENLRNISKISTERGPIEAPIPGYEGFIPRIKTSSLALGNRYHVGCERSLKMFRSEIKDHFDRFKCPVEPIKPQPSRIISKSECPGEETFSLRIFRNEGLVPNYTGSIHEHKFSFGRTMGDATRELEVCSHHYPSYGAFTRNRDMTIEKS